MLALDDLLEGTDGVLQGDVLAFVAGKLFRDMEGLGQETLDLTGTVDGDFVSLDHFSFCLITFDLE